MQHLYPYLSRSNVDSKGPILAISTPPEDLEDPCDIFVPQEEYCTKFDQHAAGTKSGAIQRVEMDH